MNLMFYENNSDEGLKLNLSKSSGLSIYVIKMNFLKFLNEFGFIYDL